MIKPLFLGLVLINLLHYFNVFNINEWLEQFYFGNKNYVGFGLNSAGLPVSKRMLGLTANPNNNAIIFCIFAILLIPKKMAARQDFLLFGLAVLMVFLCQSRTASLAFGCVLFGYAVFNLSTYKRTLLVLLISGVSIVAANLIASTTVGIGTPVNMEMVRNYEKKQPHLRWDEAQKEFINLDSGDSGSGTSDTYLETISYDELTSGTSMLGRYEIWKKLWQMIRQKPLFGHGPYKEFFYANKFYAENEFIFMTWRYGFLGLAVYLSILSMMFRMAVKNRKSAMGMNLLLVIVLYCVTSLTNLPFSSTTLNMIFAIILGVFLAELRANHKQQTVRH